MGQNAGQFFGVHMESVNSKGNLYTGEVFLTHKEIPVPGAYGKIVLIL